MITAADYGEIRGSNRGGFIKESNVQMVIEMPEGTMEPTLSDNMFNARSSSFTS